MVSTNTPATLDPCSRTSLGHLILGFQAHPVQSVSHVARAARKPSCQASASGMEWAQNEGHQRTLSKNGVPLTPAPAPAPRLEVRRDQRAMRGRVGGVVGPGAGDVVGGVALGKVTARLAEDGHGWKSREMSSAGAECVSAPMLRI